MKALKLYKIEKKTVYIFYFKSAIVAMSLRQVTVWAVGMIPRCG